MTYRTNLIGAITANTYMILIIALFILRIVGSPEIGSVIGIISTGVVLPLLYLFVIALKTHQQKFYFIWLVLMITFAIFELIIDHMLHIDFRNTQWAVILYVMFFFAATGGMIGVAAQAGKKWTIATTIVFLIMAVMAFVQRGITGY